MMPPLYYLGNFAKIVYKFKSRLTVLCTIYVDDLRKNTSGKFSSLCIFLVHFGLLDSQK
jgi:hypothetical protein